MYDFNKIDESKEKEIVAKFKEHGVGVTMGKFANGDVATWPELLKTSLYSERSIKTKMFELARVINTSCNDEFLGDTETAFTVNTELDEKIKFSYLDMYTFLRAALRYRRNTAEYKANRTKLNELKAFVESNKSTEEKLAEAKIKMAELEQKL